MKIGYLSPKHSQQETLLSELSLVGYEGLEIADLPCEQLRNICRTRRLELLAPRHPTRLLTHAYQEEEDRLRGHLATPYQPKSLIVLEEVSLTEGSPLKGRPLLSHLQKESLFRSLERLAAYAHAHGTRAIYHPQMGTVIQTPQEIEALMAATHRLGLALDIGHLLFAKADINQLVANYASRIGHIYCRSTTAQALQQHTSETIGLRQLERSGLLTVPGVGVYDFLQLIHQLHTLGYQDWLMVAPSPFEVGGDRFTHLQLAYTTLKYAQLQSAVNGKTESGSTVHLLK